MLCTHTQPLPGQQTSHRASVCSVCHPEQVGALTQILEAPAQLDTTPDEQRQATSAQETGADGVLPSEQSSERVESLLPGKAAGSCGPGRSCLPLTDRHRAYVYPVPSPQVPGGTALSLATPARVWQKGTREGRSCFESKQS
jgi:hypothetical protein